MVLDCCEANSYAVGSVDRKGRFPIRDQIGHSYGQFLCSWIGGSKRAISDRRSNQAFLRSRKSAFSIPISSIEQSDPRIPLKKSSFQRNVADRIARSNKFLTPAENDHTLQQLRCWLDYYYYAAAAAAAAAAARNDSAWHILFSARQQRVPSSDGSGACYG